VTTHIRWCRITQSGVLRFDGPDTQTFLQGQLTNNINALTATRSQYSGYCTPKGRLLATFLLWQKDGAYFMMMPRVLCEPLRKRLSMYILRAKVKASDVSDELALFGVTGGMPESIAVTAPGLSHEVLHHGGVSVIHLPIERNLVIAAAAAAAHVEASFAASSPASPPALWDALDIEAGIPSVVPATQEQFVPQTVNFDLIGAVSFDKGCYPGQEIVARTHYLGKLKQRMVRARIASGDAPAPGDKLYTATLGDQASGIIVSATAMPQPGEHDVLAVVQTNALENEAVHWQSPTGPVLQISPLPYAVK
jgi:folate-binding protein YgfZ